MLKAKKLKYYHLLMPIVMICLSSCTITAYEYCPSYPIAGHKVAHEIKNIQGEYFWEWLGRIDKLRQQLELCKKNEL